MHILSTQLPQIFHFKISQLLLFSIQKVYKKYIHSDPLGIKFKSGYNQPLKDRL